MKYLIFFLLSQIFLIIQGQYYIGAINTDTSSSTTQPIDFIIKTGISFIQNENSIVLLSNLTSDGGNGTLSVGYAANFFSNLALGLIGPQSSSSATLVSTNVANIYKKPLISFAATSVTLSNKTEHPYFMRTIPPDSKQAEVITDLLYMFDLNNFGILFTQEAYGINGANKVIEVSFGKGLKVSGNFSYPVGNQAERQRALSLIKSSGIRVINAWITSSDLPSLLSMINSTGLYGPNYLWIFSESFGQTFTLVKNQVIMNNPLFQPFVEGFLFVTFPQPFWDRGDFLFSQFTNKFSSSITFSQRFIYDIVLTYGNAISSMVSLSENVTNGDTLLSYLKKSDFLGASGRVRFDSNGDRIEGVYQITNLYSQSLIPILSWDDVNGVKMLNYNITKANGEKITPKIQLKYSLSNHKKWFPTPTISSPPSSRQKSTMEHYSKKNSFLIFGGKGSNEYFNDLYQFDTKRHSWSRVFYLSHQVPSSRYDHGSFILDDKLYIFGGTNDNIYFDDLWEFNMLTNTWRNIILNKKMYPNVRFNFNFVVINRVPYLFGGNGISSLKSDLWAYNIDSNVWSAFNPNNTPTERAGYCVISEGNNMIIWGGETNNKIALNDMWMIDVSNTTNSWRQIQQFGDVPEPRHSMNCFKMNTQFFISSGKSGNVLLNNFYSTTLNLTNLSINWTLIIKDLSSVGHTPRESSNYLSFEQYGIWIGGIQQDGALINDYWRFNYRTQDIELIHPSLEIPPSLTGHSNGLIGNTIYIFGGHSFLNQKVNSLYKFNIDEKIWTRIISTTSSPEERDYHSIVSSADSLYLFGGRGALGNYLSDTWRYSTILNAWIQLSPLASPSPRAGHCTVINQNETKIWLVGGFNGVEYLNELWEYDLLFGSWKQLEINTTKGPQNLFGYQCVLLTPNERENIIIYGGENSVGEPTSIVYSLDIEKKEYSIFNTLLKNQTVSRTTLSAISSDTVLLYGGTYKDNIVSQLLLIKNNSIQVITTNNEPALRNGHISVFYGDSIIVFGGEGSIPGKTKRMRNTIFNEMWNYQIGETCLFNSSTSCRRCSKGTYHYKGQCLSCPSGTYSDEFGSFSCKNCQPGYINTILGASSSNLCTPCPFGTYNPTEGSSICLPCNVNQTCSIGTINPENIFLIKRNATFNSIQPDQIDSKDAMESDIITASYLILISLSAVLLFLMLICWKRAKFYCQAIDFLFTRSHFPPKYSKDQIVVMRKTPLGGVYTLILLIAGLCVTIAIVLPALIQNNREIRTMIPNAVLSVSSNVITSKMNVTVTALDYTGNCVYEKMNTSTSNCSPLLSVTSNGLPILEKYSITCLQLRNNISKSCSMSFFCENCSLSISNEASLVFLFNELGSFSSGFEYFISTSSAYPDQIIANELLNRTGYLQDSKIISSIISDPSLFFRGISKFTTVSIQFLQSVYTIESLQRSTYGYLLDYIKYDIGDQVNHNNFSQTNGIGFEFKFFKAENSVEITRVKKKTEVSIIAELFGSLSGIIGLMVLFLSKTEQALRKITFYFGLIQARLRKYEKDITSLDEKHSSKKALKLNMDDSEIMVISNGKIEKEAEEVIVEEDKIIEMKPTKLIVTVIEARNLPKMDLNGFCDPYVTIQVASQTKKTSTLSKNLNPYWNETLSL